MPDVLLELRSEEIPARMQPRAADDLARLFAERLAAAGLSADIETHVTPRRLALIARGLPLETEATREERRGPRTDAPDKAVEGFLRGAGLTREQLQPREDKKGSFFYAVIETPGRRTADVLAEAIPAIVRDFPWPKSMRWGEASANFDAPRWVRPLQGVVALFGGDLIDIEIAGIRSGRTTRGHRFLSSGEIEIDGADDYAAKLRGAHVILDAAERRRRILAGAREAAASAGFELVEDEALASENAGLTEWPVPLLGRFDEAFLEVPPEVIQLAMKTHQKYFAVRDPAGNLAPAFICVANIDAEDGGKAIVEGNQKVLAARLSDARFFWEQDRKKTLEAHAKKLGDIVFHEKLGTMADKVDRVAKLARWLVEEGIIPFSSSRRTPGSMPEAPESGGEVHSMDSGFRRNDEQGGADDRARLADLAEQAARLSKADLVTGMVGEFPELQGVMGGHYARAEGLPQEVADAIRDHYKPVGQGDKVPTAPVTVAVSLADKLDTIVGFFGADMAPTGSRDPFALRRAALGILELTTTNGLRYGLHRIVGKTAQEGSRDAGRALGDFFADRLKVQQREAGVRHDLIDAVFALGGEDDIVRLLARVKALQAFIGTEDGRNLLTGYKRAANILKKEGWTGAPEQKSLSYTPEKDEARLIAALDQAEPEAQAAVEREDFADAMAALARLRAPVDSFFDTVTVNDPEPDKRAARLALLARIRDAVHRVADFSRIEG